MSSRDSMETLSVGDPDTAIGILDGRSNAKRAELKKKVEDTNQDGLFQKLGSQSFETVFNVKNTMCNFPVTLVTYEGKIKKKGSTVRVGLRESLLCPKMILIMLRDAGGFSSSKGL